MELAFSTSDIFEIAIQIEKNGSDFYRRALERLEDAGELRECFARLAAMESEHANTFLELRDRCGEKGEAAPEDGAVSYLLAFARGHVFDPSRDTAADLAELRTPEDVLKRAIVAEKDSIALYTGIKAFIADDQCGRERIDRVIAEEMGHIAELSDCLEGRTENDG